ncbi:hypothetical protein [Streptomyces europaeiscabiei]|uniref:hypothetical protein n=1 Tax=Streptomyces europaeiscabiei TaxID=146819 RepID=UPI002E16DF28
MAGEDVRAGVVACGVEVEAGADAGEVVEVESGGQDAFVPSQPTIDRMSARVWPPPSAPALVASVCQTVDVR